MSDKFVIYGLFCLCHPEDDIRYVGQTVKGMTARFGVHKAHAEWSDSPVYNWMRKHGIENIWWTILEVCLPSELDAREEFWITYFQTEGRSKLMNVRAGGFKTPGYKNPKQSQAMRGEKNPMWGKDRRDIMAHARSFQGPVSAETRAKMAFAFQGEKSANAKVTENDVREMRERHNRGESFASPGREYGLTGRMVSNICGRRSWKHVE